MEIDGSLFGPAATWVNDPMYWSVTQYVWLWNQL